MIPSDFMRIENSVKGSCGLPPPPCCVEIVYKATGRFITREDGEQAEIFEEST